MQMETREFEIRLVDADERTVSGIAVPFGEDADIAGVYKERFAFGAIEDNPQGVKLFYQHEEPIGLVFEGRNEEDGYRITAKISETARGEEVLTLLRDGVLDKFSVGFIPVESQKEGNTVVRTKVNLKEVSVVAFPAYAGASIAEVREDSATVEDREASSNESLTKENPNMENIEHDVRAVSEEVQELRRLVEVGLHTAPAAPAFNQFRSQGEYVKAFARGEDAAMELFRAAATTADSVALPPFIGLTNNIIDLGRPSLNAFSRGALPATGMSVEFAEITSNTVDVDEQAAENDALAVGYVQIGTDTAPVKTYGGYSDMSRQAVERSSIPYLDTVFRAMSIAYAKKMNSEFIATLGGIDYTGKTFDVSGGTYADIVGGITDGSAFINEATGFTPEFILVSTDAYKFFLSLEGADGRPVVNVAGAGVNNIGSGNVPALSGSLFGLPVIVDHALPTGSAYLANGNAIVTHESAGAPVRLQAEDISTLTNAYSVYGYAAFTTPWVDAVVKLDVTP